MMATRPDRVFVVHGDLFTLPIGQLATSYQLLQDRWGWSQKAVRHYLKGQTEGQQKGKQKAIQMGKQSSRRSSIITILNIEQYIKRANRRANRRHIKGQTEGQTENGRLRPSVEQVVEFCRAIGVNQDDAEYCYHHWNGNGWKIDQKPIVSWKSAIHAWKKAKYLPSQKPAGRKQLTFAQQATLNTLKAVEDFAKGETDDDG